MNYLILILASIKKKQHRNKKMKTFRNNLKRCRDGVPKSKKTRCRDSINATYTAPSLHLFHMSTAMVMLNGITVLPVGSIKKGVAMDVY